MPNCEERRAQSAKKIADLKKTGRREREQVSDFELRNWEPARRVGVRRTIADLKKQKTEILLWERLSAAIFTT
jgi:hypothetical protein